jgi:single-stranded DNA-binding protein
MAKREWKGINVNEATFQGKVIGDPVVSDAGNGKLVAFINLRAFTGELGANQQWVETPMEIPLLVMNPNKAKVVDNYVKDGRELYVKAYYKAWEEEDKTPRHAFVVTLLKLGNSPYDPNRDKTSGGGMPTIPFPE